MCWSLPLRLSDDGIGYIIEDPAGSTYLCSCILRIEPTGNIGRSGKADVATFSP